MAVLISIVGPTAVGKTALSLSLGEKYQTHILSCDARQVYKGMDKGTAKISPSEQRGIPHHFIDILEVDQSITVGQFEEKADELLDKLFQDYQVVIAVGGSTLYFHTLWYGIDEIPEVNPKIREGLRAEWEAHGLSSLLKELEIVDPATYEVIDRQNHVRVLRALEVYLSSGQPISAFHKQQRKEKGYQHIKIGLSMDRETLYPRIDARVDQMLENGLLTEVEGLMKAGYSLDQQAMRTIGYQELIQHFHGEYPLEEAIRLIKRNSRRYAKRQMTFYRRYDDIRWFQFEEVESIPQWVDEQLGG
ncbi:MAG: tRNA (adenosine(37)-N6)-dimethylallyltransferase MiaA [Bacteroidota bacterium]